jgi:DNA ligase-associated metallophosphoesterase
MIMPESVAARVNVTPEVVIDGRLALFHPTQRWLAVADLHFGFELSHRAAGNLFPLWGMRTIETRLLDLLGEYQPARLVLLGDLVHDRSGAAALAALIARLRRKHEVVLIAGNHDRKLTGPRRGEESRPELNLRESWESEGFYFHHGHCAADRADCIQIIGHHHPAGVLRDGAGLHLKLPGLVQQQKCWILPAFSPWAGGTVWPNDEDTTIWLCSPERVLQVPQRQIA